jgi:hypothetical protein
MAPETGLMVAQPPAVAQDFFFEPFQPRKAPPAAPPPTAKQVMRGPMMVDSFRKVSKLSESLKA